ncbi:MAG: acyl-CoA dehydrogenase family protein [Bacteroidales bacterium]
MPFAPSARPTSSDAVVPGADDLVNGIAAFLDARHREIAHRGEAYAETQLVARPEPVTDDGARIEAREVTRRLGEAGLLAPIEEQDLRALCLTREAFAAASPLADACVALQALCATTILLGANEDARDEWLPGLVGGRTVGAFAMTEPEAGSDVAGMRTTARRDGDRWVLDGEKHLISNAGIADLYVVFAVTSPGAGSRGLTAFVVPAVTPGCDFTGAQVMAAPHPLGRLRFAGCAVPATAVLGQVDRGFKLGMMALDRLRPSVGAAACGFAGRALREATAHARDRRQFGHPLADLQLVREKIGRMATELDAARLLVYRAAWECDRGAERLTAHAAMAKSFATEAAQRIVDDAVQIVGGRGVLVGHPVERLYRAVRALRIYEGATDVLRLIVGGTCLEGAAAPAGEAGR